MALEYQAEKALGHVVKIAGTLMGKPGEWRGIQGRLPGDVDPIKSGE
jgi:hypothetical protein